MAEELVSRAADLLLSGAALPLPAAEEPKRSERFWWDTFVNVRRRAGSRESAVKAVVDAVRSELEVGQAAANTVIGPACMSLVLSGQMHLAGSLIDEVLVPYPSSARARIQLSKVHFWSGNLDAARYELAVLCAADKSRLTNAVLVQCAMAYRAWDLLSEIREALSSEPADDAGVGGTLKKVSTLLSLERARNAVAGYRVTCINLDRDIHRFEGIVASYRDIGLQLKRYPGVFGESVPALAKKDILPAGAPHNMVGCCLSHLGVWESIASGPEGMTLVLEDDGLPNFDFDLGAFIDGLPKDVDLCFVNDRLMPDWPAAPLRAYSTVALDEAWSSLPQSTRAVGADAYLLSRSGAEKLVKIVGKFGIPMNLDWFLCAVGLDARRPLRDGHANNLIKRTHGAIKNWPLLNARVATVPLVGHQPLGFTARHHFADSK